MICIRDEKFKYALERHSKTKEMSENKRDLGRTVR